MTFADSLQQRWYEHRPPPWWTLPIAALFAAASHIRRALYRSGLLRREKLPVPVIVVGNLTVGGTGKTPLVIALVEALRARGFAPGVVSRGYGGSARAPMLLDDKPDPRTSGDEPALIRLRCGAPVAIGRDRPAAARLLLDQDVDVIVADDGLQHYALRREIEICVLDGERRFGNGKSLPAGPLREPLQRLCEMDFVICNGGAPQSAETPMRLQVKGLRNVREPSLIRALEALHGQQVHAVAGIGNPDRFFAMLRERGIGVIAHPFPDHHRFVPNDLEFDDGLPVLMTEKDAVKCAGFAQLNWWCLPLSVELPQTFFDAIADRLRAGERASSLR